jgi:hypothetical protein
MRRLKYPPKPTPAEALELTLDAMPAKKKRKSSARSTLDKAMAEAELFRTSGNWKNAKGRHFVALFAWLHLMIYETEAIDLLDGKSMLAASSAADKMLRVDFDGEAKRMVEFVSWCWSRERESIKRNKGGRRLNWRLQFALRNLLVDYRVDLMRAGR